VKRRALFGSLGALLLSSAAAISFSRVRRLPPPQKHGPARLISLSPALTETVLALRSVEQLVGVSDFCELPSGLQLPRVGSALTPNYEAIAQLQPTLILSDGSVASKARALAEIAPCETLPWLTLNEVTASTRRLGAVLGQRAAGDALAAKLQTRLSQKPPAHAPRVLLLLSYDTAQPAEMWFIKRNSLHGAALAAAGARNAVDRDVPGLPKLGLEELVALDPDFVMILPPPRSSPEKQRELVRVFADRVPLRAAQQGRVMTVRGTQSVGPSILQLVDALEQALASGLRRE
jgi:ABC-type Fe3+-hydroxamate transport system substrate-binding protein